MTGAERLYCAEIVKLIGKAAVEHAKDRAKRESEVAKRERIVQRERSKLEYALERLRAAKRQRPLKTHYVPRDASWTMRNYWTPERRKALGIKVKAGMRRSRREWLAFERRIHGEDRQERKRQAALNEARREHWPYEDIEAHHTQVQRAYEERLAEKNREEHRRAWQAWIERQPVEIQEQDRIAREAARRREESNHA